MVTGKELVFMLSVSDQPIRSDIEHITKEYECTLIEANRRKGYHLDEMLTSVKGITTKVSHSSDISGTCVLDC